MEFGTKCINIQIDGIPFIGKLSFNAFNEDTRLKHCVKLAEKLFGESVARLAGDYSYSGNGNRSFCSGRGIETSFTSKKRLKRVQGTTSDAVTSPANIIISELYDNP